MLLLLKRLFGYKFPREVFPDTKFPIEEAFKVNGVQYYRFQDYFNIPYERGLKTVTFYEEAKMKITLKFMQEHTEAVDKILTNPKAIDVFKLKNLNDILKERLALAFDTEILYKLASIVYFDANENPKVYDFTYNQEKIAFWKKQMRLKDFFLQSPTLELMPFLKDAEENLEMYSQITGQLNAQHSDYLSSILSTSAT